MIGLRRTLLISIAIGAWVLGLPQVCRAQLPTATGRSFTLSDPAWKLFIPSNYVPRASPVADVLVHFHGDSQIVWNNAKYANLNAIVLTANYGAVSSAYQTPFTSNPNLYANILNEALAKVQQQADFPDTLQWDKVGVATFSAGYASLREILKNPTYYNDIDGIVMADSLYASYTSGTDLTPLDSQMVDFRKFALAAKNGTKRMIMSHSQVPTSGYCDTIATSDDILQYLGTSATAVNTTGLGGIHFYRTASSGNYSLYGATGSDGAAHLLHVNYEAQWMTQLPLAHVPEPGVLGLIVFVPVIMRRRR